MYNLILASSSPRRREILKTLDFDFRIVNSPYVEDFDKSNFTYDLIEHLAFEKANAVLPTIIQPSLIISADTVVVLDSKILCKPKNYDEALAMLESLSGKKHSVVTSICIINSQNKEFKTLSTTSYVEFNNLSKNMIEDYINEFKPYDKAGSYGIQELPSGFVNHVDGSFENIVGLCPKALIKLLQLF